MTAPRCGTRVRLLVLLAAALLQAPTLAAPPFEVPGWAYPGEPMPARPPVDPAELVGVPGSTVRLPRAVFTGGFEAPDWFPDEHPPAPAVVLHGVAPDVYACGYCHTPGGQGRPENSALAGLPADYIVRQLADFASGTRRSAAPRPDRPAEAMQRVAAHATPEQVAAAADYFAHERLGPRVVVRERARVPRTRAYGFLYGYDPAGGDEPLGERLIEAAPDMERHELHDERLVYEAWVPPGSLARGRRLARRGAPGVPACSACHGADLRGMAAAPPIAGRFCSTLLRQLIAFRTGARAGEGGQAMRVVVAELGLGDMVAAVAYAASLPP